MVAFMSAGKRAAREGLPTDIVMNLAPWIIIGAIVGARVLYVITFWEEEFAKEPLVEIFKLRRSGLVYYGGLVGASLGTIIYARKNKIHLWRLGDIMAPSIALGHAFGRIGCLMTGCCYGCPTDVPWAIHFPKDHWTHGVGVHPTQIYESALNFLLFFALSWLYRHKKFHGQVFAAYLIAYALLRAVVEVFRGDYDKPFLIGIATPGQTVSIVVMMLGIGIWVMQKKSSEPKVIAS
jgi:phosphatidylglycerol---prolipoprotein diacylglyceryl transferase